MAFGDFNVQSYWNAATNTPKLVSGKGMSGKGYLVSVAGSTFLDGISDWQQGDIAMFVLDQWTRLNYTGIPKTTTTMSLAEFGAVSNGTDQSAAFNLFNIAAQDANLAGKRVILDCTPNHPTGIWAWDMAGSPTGFNMPFESVTDLTIEGNGCKFHQLNTGQPSWQITPLNQFDDLSRDNWLINTALAYTSSVTLNPIVAHVAGNYTTPDFQPGDWVMIGSLAIQEFGSPMNLERFDYARVVSWNQTTGVLQLDRALEYDHLSTFPETGYNSGSFGAARVYQLKYAGLRLRGGVFTAETFDTMLWAYDHEYKNFEVLPSGGSDQFVFRGRRFKASNCILPGVLPSILLNWHTEDCRFRGICEPDKLVKNIYSENDIYDQQLPFQSASIDNVTLINPTVMNGTSIGGKRFSIKGGTGYISGWGRYGYCRSAVLEGFKDTSQFVPEFGEDITIDGTNVAWINGSIRVKRDHGYDVFRVVIGQQLLIRGTSFRFAGDMGIIHVLGLRQDATYFYIDTDGPNTWPSWGITGPQRVKPVVVPNRKYIECSGDSAANMATMAGRKGLKTVEFFSFRCVNPTSANGDIQGNFSQVGRIKRIDFKVMKVGSSVPAGATAEFVINAPYNSVDLSDLTALHVFIDLNRVGARSIDWTGSIGLGGNDLVRLDPSTTVTTLAQNWMLPNNLSWSHSYDPSVLTPQQNSTWQIDIITDAGILGDIYPMVHGGHAGFPVQLGGGGGGP